MPKQLTNIEFIEKLKKIHGDLYDYSNVCYSGYRSNIILECPKHGVFITKAQSLLNSKIGCKKCSIILQSSKVSLSNEEFISKSKNVHGELYDYSLIDYKNNRTKVKIKCVKHGVFEQIPINHLNGSGCFECKIKSIGELKIKNILNSRKIDFVSQKKFENCKHKKQLSYDFYIENRNLLIEYDGQHHFIPITKYGSDIEFENFKIKDGIKNEYAKNNGIKLIRIPYTEYNNIEKILNDHIK